MRKNHALWTSAVFLCAASASSSPLNAQHRLPVATVHEDTRPRVSPGTQFTYQGRVRSGGVTLNGPHEFDVRLFPTPTGGTQIGSTNSFTGVTVTNGLFSLTLDFGSGAFDGSARYLGIAVDGGPELTPRTQNLPTPYAMQAAHADSTDNATNADTLDGIDSTGFSLTGHTHAHSSLTGLGADDHTQYLLVNGTRAMTGSLSLGANQLISTLPTGTAPFSVASTTLVTNLNADQLDGLDSTAFSLTSHTHAHSSLTGLAGDDHTQYALLAGRSGGQSLTGGTAASESFTLNSTTNATKGNVLINTGGGKIGLGTASPGTNDTVTVAGTTSTLLGAAQNNTAGQAISGTNSASSGAAAYGVFGSTSSSSNSAGGVFGSATGGSSGVRGDTANSGGYGVYGTNTGSTTAVGVRGDSSGASGFGVQGINNVGGGNGVRGQTSSQTGIGVVGINTSTATTTGAGFTYGIQGLCTGVSGTATGIGVLGQGTNQGVQGTTTSTTGVGILGIGNSGGASVGVQGQTAGTTGTGVVGFVTASGSATNTGVVGQSNVTDGTGVSGVANGAGTLGPWGVSGSTSGAGGTTIGSAAIGVRGSAGSTSTGTNFRCGVYGEVTTAATNAYAGWFNGKVNITGAITKGSGTFKIDHPLDPTNKWLYHSFVESPDMKNIYDGIAVLDGSGMATVELPAWFGTLNKDFRYQLTCIGGFAQVYIKSEVQENKFQIAGGQPGMKVSWQVTGVRQDPYANKYRVRVEEDKGPGEKGLYMYPEAYDQPAELGINFIRPTDKAARVLNTNGVAPVAFPAAPIPANRPRSMDLESSASR